MVEEFFLGNPLGEKPQSFKFLGRNEFSQLSAQNVGLEKTGSHLKFFCYLRVFFSFWSFESPGFLGISEAYSPTIGVFNLSWLIVVLLC